MRKAVAYFIKKPTLCLVVGVPGSGKTILAEGLARNIVNSAYISKDLIQTPFTDTERISGSTYSLIQGPAFQILIDFADVHLGFGKTPIIDAPFSVNHGRNDKYRDWVLPFERAARKYGARLAIVRCLPPSEEILKARIEERLTRNESKWDSWKIDHWTDFLRREPLHFPIPHDDVLEFVSDGLFEGKSRDVLMKYLGAEEYPAGGLVP
jgi:predicted kinase